MPVCTLQDWHSHWIEFISKRQSAAKTTKYSSTRITTLVFVHYYASTYSFSISTHAVFLHSSFTIQLYFTHFSVPYFSLSLSLLFSDRNHITKFTNITHTLKNEPLLYAHKLHIRDEKSSHNVLLLSLQIEHHHHDTRSAFCFVSDHISRRETKK